MNEEIDGGPDRSGHVGRSRRFFFDARDRSSGDTVLLRALEALQGERYLRLASDGQMLAEAHQCQSFPLPPPM